MTESEKMKLGLWYDANYDQELSEEREKAEDLYFTFNHTAPKEKALREDILKTVLRSLLATTVLSAQTAACIQPFMLPSPKNAILGWKRRFRLLLAITSGWAVMSPFFQVSPLVEIPLSVPEASSQRIFLPMSLPPVIHAVFSVQLQRPTALQRNNRGSKK